MDVPNARDEFERIELYNEIERARLITQQYEKHLAFYRYEIENKRYQLGRLDERLGSRS